jgi:hypothetical protein
MIVYHKAKCFLSSFRKDRCSEVHFLSLSISLYLSLKMAANLSLPPSLPLSESLFHPEYLRTAGLILHHTKTIDCSTFENYDICKDVEFTAISFCFVSEFKHF